MAASVREPVQGTLRDTEDHGGGSPYALVKLAFNEPPPHAQPRREERDGRLPVPRKLPD